VEGSWNGRHKAGERWAKMEKWMEVISRENEEIKAELRRVKEMSREKEERIEEALRQAREAEKD